MAETVTASDGTQLPLADLPQTLAYSGGFISTITVTYPSRLNRTPTNYVQTFTNNGTNITNISNFVAT